MVAAWRVEIGSVTLSPWQADEEIIDPEVSRHELIDHSGLHSIELGAEVE